MKACLCSSVAQSISVRKTFWDTLVTLVLRLLLEPWSKSDQGLLQKSNIRKTVSARIGSMHLMRHKQLSFKTHGLLSICSKKKATQKDENFSLFPLWEFLGYHRIT